MVPGEILAEPTTWPSAICQDGRIYFRGSDTRFFFWLTDLAERMRDRWTNRQRTDLDTYAADLTEALRQVELYHEGVDA